MRKWKDSKTRIITDQRRPGEGTDAKANDHERYAQRRHYFTDVELRLNVFEIAGDNRTRECNLHDRYGTNGGDICEKLSAKIGEG